MRKQLVWAAIAILAAACATTRSTPEGAKVRVYEANLKTPAAARRLPDGCRVVATSGPVNQMESERQLPDPYASQRNDTASRGGNVLLVLSDLYRSLPKTDCAPSDTSPDCQSRSQNWYLVSFESYACDEPSLQALASLQPSSTGVASWWPWGREKTKTASTAAPASTPSASSPAPAAAPSAASAPASVSGIAPSELKAKILVLMREGVGADVIVAYVKTKPVSAALSAEEILDWKKSGIADAVIEAALAQATPAR